MRALAANLAWVAVMVILFFAALFYMVPSVQAATCAGQVATASWYGKESCISDPCKTRSGELFTGRQMTAAMASPRHIGERWRVSPLKGGKSIIVRINDTGGFAKYGRGIDLAKAAFARLAPLGNGTLKVCIVKLS